jgi:hypothetical protein
VELNIDDFTRIRFGQDKRLDEVARMLRSSEIPTVRMIERPELRCVPERIRSAGGRVDRHSSTASMTR